MYKNKIYFTYDDHTNNNNNEKCSNLRLYKKFYPINVKI